MRTSYGVVWREGDLPSATGKLELLPRVLRLEGGAGSHTVTRDIDYGDLAAVRVGRAPDERVDGRPSVILERRRGVPITVATVAQPSVVSEIAERLSALQLGAARRTMFVVPLREGSHEAVQALLDAGPPFDPELAPGLDRHEVFLTPDEAIFLFESPLGASVLDALLTEPDLWKAAAEWRDHLAGPPRIAENAYAWTRPGAAAEPALRSAR